MIASISQKIQERRLINISLVHKAAMDFSMADVSSNGSPAGDRGSPFDLIVCGHGFSAMDNYDDVFTHTASFLKPGGAYVVMDLYYKRRDLITRFNVNVVERFLLGSNTYHRCWEPLKRDLSDFTMNEKEFTMWFGVRGAYYVARGIKNRTAEDIHNR